MCKLCFFLKFIVFCFLFLLLVKKRKKTLEKFLILETTGFCEVVLMS